MSSDRERRTARGWLRSPIGDLTVEATARGISLVLFPGAAARSSVGASAPAAPSSVVASDSALAALSSVVASDSAPAALSSVVASDAAALSARDGSIGTDLAVPGQLGEARAHLAAALAQLAEYFERTRRGFDLELDLAGTDFERSVWDALRRIPYGETRTYAQIASAVGSPGASRATGAANGKNPIPIIVPCHRVIGADGSLTGFGGGLENKRWLLEHESGARRLFGAHLF